MFEQRCLYILQVIMTYITDDNEILSQMIIEKL